MKSDFSSEAIIKSLKSNKCILFSNFELGYVPGLPILAVRNGHVCMMVPYLRYKVTGEIDKTYVYPTRYVVTVSLPEGVVAGIEDLSFNHAFANIKFNSPVGLFRHSSIKDLDKKAYQELRSSLFIEYDKIIRHLVDGASYTDTDESHFKALLNVILEPSLIPFYTAIDTEFASKYITSNKFNTTHEKDSN